VLASPGHGNKAPPPPPWLHRHCHSPLKNSRPKQVRGKTSWYETTAMMMSAKDDDEDDGILWAWNKM